MNRFLDFRNQTLEKEFYESHHLSKSKSSRLINIMIGCFAVTYTLRYIADILFNPDSVLITTFAGLGIIYGAIGLFYLGRYLFTRFKPKTNKIDITVLIVALAAVICLNNPYRNPKIPCDPSYSIFWDSFEIGVFNLIIILQMRRWYHKAVYFASVSIYLISVYHHSMYDNLMSIKIVGFIVLVSFIFYFMEKSMRLNFIEKYHQEVSTKHILSALPEGIVIIDEIFQCLHSNPSMEKMFPELDPENKISVQAFMKSIKDPKPRVFFPDFKNQISEKIFLAQEKIRNGGRLRSNSIISEEGPSPNSTTNNYKQVSNGCSSNAKASRKGLLYGLLRKDKEELKAIRLDSNEGTATGTGTVGTSPTACTPQSISLFTYIQAFFEVFQGSNTVKLDYENVLEHHYFDAKHDDKTLEISLSFIDFLNKRCFLLIFRDKTHRDLIEKLESSTKYKSRVLSTVSHELRTPVTSSLHLLNASMESSEIPAKCVENYIRPASRVLVMMLNLINDILDYSQLKEEKLKVVFQPVDIRNIITEALSLIEIQAKKKGIALRLDFDPFIPSLFETDPNRFTQILLNLLSNALKFTSKGEITVSAFTITDEEAQGLLEISVKDTGIGIKEADAKKLFVEFEKIDLGEDQKMNSNGCGLGLNIANRLAKHLSREQFGGIKVTSQVGKGSVFSFVIENKRRLRQSLGRMNSKNPKASLFRASKANSEVGSRKMSDILDVSIHNITEIKDDEDPVSKKLQRQSFARGSCKRDYNISSIAPTTQENYLFGGQVSDEDEYDSDACICPKILIVDDDAFNLLTLEAMLTSLNYTVKSCFNGEEAVREVTNRHETKVCGQGCTNFQFIFMDSNMPIKTGPEAASEIKQYLQENGLSAIPIIGLSSYCMNDENKELMANMDFCLEKPVTKEKIKELLWSIKEEDFSRL